MITSVRLVTLIVALAVDLLSTTAQAAHLQYPISTSFQERVLMDALSLVTLPKKPLKRVSLVWMDALIANLWTSVILVQTISSCSIMLATKLAQ